MCLGIPGRITAITDSASKLAMVDVLGVQREINIACVLRANETPQDCVDTWVLVHVGFAMSRIDEREAALTLELLHALGEAQAEVRAMQESALS